MRAISRADIVTPTSKGCDSTPQAGDFQPQSAPQAQRFVAGATFFHYDAFGSLRPGLERIQLFSSSYVGLAVHAVLSGFAFHFLTFGFGCLLGEYLKATREQQVDSANYLLLWPQALAVFVGLFSDAFTAFGYRRKGSMVLGWALSCTMFIAITILDVFSKSGDKLYDSVIKRRFDRTAFHVRDPQADTYVVVYLLVSLVAALGLQISWIAALALSIDYAQREHLHHRGRLQATLLALYYFGGVIAKLLTALVISDGVSSDHLVSEITLGQAAMCLAGIAMFAIPFISFCLDEEPLADKANGDGKRSNKSCAQRLKQFWKFCHQNVVYRVLFFVCLHLLLLGLFNQNVRDAVKQWSRVTRKTTLWIDVAEMAGQVVGSVLWKYALRNVSWRKLSFWGTTAYLAVYMALTLCTTYDVVRSPWFYGGLLVLIDVPRAWLNLFTLILATEISEIGHEGVTFGLGLSYQTLAGLSGYTLGDVFPKLFGFKVSVDEVSQDTSATRQEITKAFAIVVAFNVVSYLTIWLAPHQKLDAQQMRAFGGYNRFASWTLLVLFVVLLSANLAVNLVAVL